MTYIENAWTQEFDKLRVTSLTKDQHERTCGYWFTVTTGAQARTAFRTRDELNRWLTERGLTLAPTGWTWANDRQVSTPLKDAGEFSIVDIIGTYRKVSHRDVKAYEAIEPIFTVEIIYNAQPIPAKVTDDDDMRTIHFMNVNYR